jgi:predicted nucleic acid-binding protein
LGSVLDSTTVISAERARQTAAQLIVAIQDRIGDQPVVLSAVGYTELLIGLRRETNPVRLRARESFFDHLIQAAPVEPYTEEVAELAGRVSGEQAKLGINIPFSDLLIGSTALLLGYSVLTANLRHFRLIPGLEVIAF